MATSSVPALDAASSMPAWKAALLGTAFLAGTAAPAVRFAMTGELDTSFEQEQRPPAPAPGWPQGVPTDTAYFRSVEAWFDDHFTLRRDLLRLHNLFVWYVLRDSPSDVMPRGKDGWLFLRAQNALSASRGDQLFDEDSLGEWVELFAAWRDYLAARDCEYVFLIPPEKSSVYPEYLPSHLQPVSDVTCMDQFIEAARRDAGLEILDVRPELFAAKQKHLIYYPLGTHWNDLGAWHAYVAITEWMHARGMAPGPYPRELWNEIDPRTLDPNWIGDSFAEQMHIQGVLGQELTKLVPSRQPAWRVVEQFMRPNRQMDGRIVQPTPDYPKALLVRDSFGEWVWQFVANHVREMLSETVDRMPVHLVERERPELLIQVRVERFLLMAPPTLDQEPEEIELARRYLAAAEPIRIDEPLTLSPGSSQLASLVGPGAGVLRLEREPGERLALTLSRGNFESEVRFDEGRRWAFVALQPSKGELLTLASSESLELLSAAWAEE